MGGQGLSASAGATAGLWQALGVGALRLLTRALAVAGIVGVISFALMRSLPGDAAYRIAAGRYGYDIVDTAAADKVRAELGLDNPWWQQLAAWLGDLSRLELGRSMVSGEPVIEELAHQLGHTVGLSLAAWCLALAIGLAAGTAVALAGRGWLDRLLGMLSLGFKATPTFVLGLGLATLLAVHWNWLPAAGHGDNTHLVLPALTLALGLAAGLSQVTLHRMRQVLATPSVAFARTKGLPPVWVVLRHVLRNTAVPVTAYAGMQLVLLIEGVVVVESFFAWPGIGHALIHALIARDVPMVQGTALCMGLMFVLLSAMVDGLCWLLDPRLQAQG
jgi:peptide/nickel transport system permease protein